MKSRNSRIAATLLALTGLAALATAQGNGNGQGDNSQGNNDQKRVHELNPYGAAYSAANISKGTTGKITPQITYHGGPLIATPTVYFIWYGNWNRSNNSDTPAGQQILRDLAHGLSGSPYFYINTTYSVSPTTITGNTTFVPTSNETTDAYSQGASLSDAAILTIVNNALSSGRLPYNANGVYFVLTSSDVNETSGFCSQYCGWHDTGTALYNGKTVRYSFVGNANRCLSACAAQSTSPNNNPGVDGMASVVSHELEEAVTDPDLNAWWNRSGYESADMCAWTFGQTIHTAANGSGYNMTLTTASGTSTRQFLIQRQLKQASSGDYCYISWNGSTGAQ